MSVCVRMSAEPRENVKALLHPEVIMVIKKENLERLVVTSALGGNWKTS